MSREAAEAANITVSIERAAEALERLAKAVEGVRIEVEKLGQMKHGGVEFHMVGDLATAKVLPA